MIHYESKSLFIHIPRTSGISIARAVLSQDLEIRAPSVILGYNLGMFWRHSQAHKLKDLLPDWDVLEKFTIVRNPWRIAESSYRHFHQKQQALPLDHSFQAILGPLCALPFGDFVIHTLDFLRKGFFAHWALEWETFNDLGVKAFKFEDLDWGEVSRILQIEGPRPHENAAPPQPMEWTDEAVSFLKSRCSLDFELFGYPECPYNE